MGSDQTFRCNPEEHAADQDSRVAAVGAPEGDHSLKDGHSCREGDNADADAQEIYEETDDEGGEDVGQSEDGIEEIKLGLADVQLFLHGVLEGLGVIEGILVTEDNHGEQEKREEAHRTVAVGDVGAGGLEWLHIKEINY